MKVSNVLASLAIGTAATVTMAAVTPSEPDNIGIAPAMAVTDFELYQPPDTLHHEWYDYMKDTATAAPSPNNNPTAYPTNLQPYPYQMVLWGGYKDSKDKYQGAIFVVYSKVPATEVFQFEYLSSRSSYGQIRAIERKTNKIGWKDEHEVVVMYREWTGMPSGQVDILHWTTSNWVPYTDPYRIDFDFIYEDCSSLNMEGWRNISNVPYNYIISCVEGHSNTRRGGSGGNGGNSSSSSSGGSSGGGSSGSSGGGSVPSGIPGGPGKFPEPESSWSDWEPSGEGRSAPEEYPWEDDSSIPEKNWNPTIPEHTPGSEADTGEKGDTWELPEYTIPDLPFTTDDLNIPPMPDLNLPQVPVPDFDFPAMPGMPDVTPPQLDYYPDDMGQWPPPFPGMN